MRIRSWVAPLVCAAAAWPTWSQAQFVVNDARLLASGCFQCHGTDGKNGVFTAIAGTAKLDMLKKLSDMSKNSPGSNIMNPHARGYNSTQLSLIADYFSKQK